MRKAKAAPSAASFLLQSLLARAVCCPALYPDRFPPVVCCVGAVYKVAPVDLGVEDISFISHSFCWRCINRNHLPVLRFHPYNRSAAAPTFTKTHGFTSVFFFLPKRIQGGS